MQWKWPAKVISKNLTSLSSCPVTLGGEPASQDTAVISSSEEKEGSSKKDFPGPVATSY